MLSANRNIRGVVLAALVAGLAIAIWQLWATTPTAGAPNQDGWVSTQWGPLGPGDRDMVIKVRLAGLWEHPVGQEASERATQPRVREIAGNISREHVELDGIVIGIARDLGIQLPNQPTDQQQEWMSDISAQAGTAYDETMVMYLRQAHGGVLPLLSQVRANTRNDKVRELAETAHIYVNRHIGYLESTGLVKFDELPEPTAPARAVVTREGRYENLPVALSALAVLAALGAVVWFLLAARKRRTAKPPHVPPDLETVRIPAHRRRE